jgi:thioredoxin-related protein
MQNNKKDVSSEKHLFVFNNKWKTETCAYKKKALAFKRGGNPNALMQRSGKNANYLSSLPGYVEKVNRFMPLLRHGEMKEDGKMYKYKTWVTKIERRNDEQKDMNRKVEWKNQGKENVLKLRSGGRGRGMTIG